MFRQFAEPKIIPGKTVVVEDAPPAAAPKDGEMLVKMAMIATAPSLAARLAVGDWEKDQMDDYPAYQLNQPTWGEVVVQVVESKAEGFKTGDKLVGMYPHYLYQTIKADGSDTLFKSPPTKLDPKVPAEKYLGVLSITAGLTAYYTTEYLDAGKVGEGCDGGKTVLVTAAGSATGQVAGQLYKLKGCKVIGSTSTRAKADDVMKLGGFDAVIAYKDEDFETKLTELAPGGIDIDFENVGGPMFDIVLRHMKKFGTVLMCGAINDYNNPNPYGTKAVMSIVLKRLRIQGLMVFEIMPHIVEAITNFAKLVGEGKITSLETKIKGFELWAEGLNMMLSSKASGRLVVEVDPGKDEL